MKTKTRQTMKRIGGKIIDLPRGRRRTTELGSSINYYSWQRKNMLAVNPPESSTVYMFTCRH